jgi:hypothetical protein
MGRRGEVLLIGWLVLSSAVRLLIGAVRPGDRGDIWRQEIPTMSQDECLASPHHFTYLGVCYEGTNATITISSPQHPQPVKFSVTSVPEPSTAALFAVALVVGVVLHRVIRTPWRAR